MKLTNRSHSIEVGPSQLKQRGKVDEDQLILVQELIENQLRIDRLEKGIKEQFGQKNYLGPKTKFIMNK